MKKIALFLLTVAYGITAAHAQLGSIDPGFLVGDAIEGVEPKVNAIELLPEGKMLIAGHFDTYDKAARKNIVRLNSDGSLDTAFVSLPDWRSNSYIYDICLQKDGKILLAGQFPNANGAQAIIRLESDGSIDTSFHDGSQLANSIKAVAVQEDGKILIGGKFSHYGGVLRYGIARLHPNGAIDTTFNTTGGGVGGGTGYEQVNSIVLLPDGKSLIGGIFTKYNGATQKNLARILENGRIDSTFISGTGVAGLVNAIALYPDGRIFIAGDFTQINGVGRQRVARLKANGLIDSTFNPALFTPYASISGANLEVYSVIIQPDEKIILGGKFQKYNNVSRNCIVRIHSDGSSDNTFLVGTGFQHGNGGVYSMALQADAKIVVGGSFSRYNTTDKNNLLRLIGDNTTSGTTVLSGSPAIQLFPNPANESVSIHNIQQGSRLSIMDMTGKLIYQTMVTDNAISINTSKFSDGMYLIQVVGDNVQENKPLLINH